MSLHYRTQHERAEDDDQTSNRQTTYSATSSGSSPPSNALSEGHQGINELLEKNGAVVDAGGRRGSVSHSMRTGHGLVLAAAALGSQVYRSITTSDSQSDYSSSAMLRHDDGCKQGQLLPSLQQVVESMSLSLPLSFSHISIFRCIVSL